MAAFYAIAKGGCRGVYHNRADFDLAMPPDFITNALTRKCKTAAEAEEFLAKNPDKFAEKNAFYAVGAAGPQRKHAVFDNSDKCKKFLDAEIGFKKSKKFRTLREALDFVWAVQNEPPNTKRKKNDDGCYSDSESPFKKSKAISSTFKPPPPPPPPPSPPPSSRAHYDTPTVYTKGLHSNNGQGYGIYWGDDHPDNRSAPVSSDRSHPTNNRAELHAVLAALSQAISNGLPAIRICTNSTYVVNLFTNKNTANLDLIKKIRDYRNKIRIEFQFVRKIHGNEMAKELAEKGMKL